MNLAISVILDLWLADSNDSRDDGAFVSGIGAGDRDFGCMLTAHGHSCLIQSFSLG